MDKKQITNEPVWERIKTLEDAIREIGEDHETVRDLKLCKGVKGDVEAYLQLRIITAAYNEGWKPEIGQWWYSPYLRLYRDLETAKEIWGEDAIEIPSAVRACLLGGSAGSGALAGLADVISSYAPGYARVDVGSRLCYRTPELAKASMRNFIDIWCRYLLPCKE